ncbi:MAG TPA: branched-chain amino acid ABC transporter permease [Oligoflexia bacterium]|nr:branched-chain amino acid ABC transporter permease [Oligoflexia bacterium]HMP26933.1 branched-chain amino acid ABC transporter permease [Oligoflexia bacterium]
MNFEIFPQLILNSLIAGSIYAVGAAGLAVIYSLFGFFNFAHGQAMMLGAYFFYLYNVLIGADILATIVLFLFSIIVFSLIILKIFILPFKKFHPILTLISTLCLGVIIESLVSIFFGVNVKTFAGFENPKSIEVFSFFITPLQIKIIFFSLIFIGALAFFFNSSSFGRLFKALAERETVGESLGINKTSFFYFAFATAILMAAISGIMLGFETNLQPTMGHAHTPKVFAAMLLGGVGNLWGTIVGSYFLALIENIVAGIDLYGYSLSVSFKDSVALICIILILLFKPTGLFRRCSRNL